MAFRYILGVITLILSMSNYAAETKFESVATPQFELPESNTNVLSGYYYESGNLVYSSSLDPNYNCTSNDFWCGLKFGVTKAFESGTNGIMISGYAYHINSKLHLPTSYYGGVNEIPYGVGHFRTFYNPQYNTEYSLYAAVFVDSFYKPETQVGYMYQQYFDLNDSGKIKWEIGYTPFVFTKSSYTYDVPILLPGLAPVTSLKAYNVDVMILFFGVFYAGVRVDL